MIVNNNAVSQVIIVCPFKITLLFFFYFYLKQSLMLRFFRILKSKTFIQIDTKLKRFRKFLRTLKHFLQFFEKSITFFIIW